MAKKFDGVIEAVRYKNGQIEVYAHLNDAAPHFQTAF